MNKLTILVLAFCGLLISSCIDSTTDNADPEVKEPSCQEWEEKWIVASRTLEIADFPVVWWIKRNGSSEWTLHYPPFVNGFDYEEGYEYEILVLAKSQDINTIPADSPSVLYFLIRVISKQQKESEGLPD